MSKGNMLLGYAHGKVGSLVFTRRKGEQITRARNFHPSNPRSPRQISQRMKIYAPVQFYKSSIASQFKFAFEDQRVNETPFNAFMRHNLVLSPYVSKTLAGEYAPVPFPAVLSAGSAPSVAISIANINTVSQSGQPTNWIVGINFSSVGNLDQHTVAEVSEKLMQLYPELQQGDMLTFVTVRAGGLSIENGDVLYNGVDTFHFSYKQFIIDTSDSTDVENLGFAVGWDDVPGDSGPNYMGYVGGDAPFNQETFLQAGTIIVSRRVGDNVVASNSKLQLNEQAHEVYNTMRTNAYRDKAALTYNVGSEALLDPNKQEV